MTTSHTLSSFDLSSMPAPGAADRSLQSLAKGHAVSMIARSAMLLRVGQGQAWVTLSEGPHPHADLRHDAAASGDVFLCAGQVLQVAAGQQVVVEPLGDRSLQYRWSDAADARDVSPAPWWRRAAVGMPSAAPDPCIA